MHWVAGVCAKNMKVETIKSVSIPSDARCTPKRLRRTAHHAQRGREWKMDLFLPPLVLAVQFTPKPHYWITYVRYGIWQMYSPNCAIRMCLKLFFRTQWMSREFVARIIWIDGEFSKSISIRLKGLCRCSHKPIPSLDLKSTSWVWLSRTTNGIHGLSVSEHDKNKWHIFCCRISFGLNRRK